MNRINVQEMARAVESWYPLITSPGKAFDKAMSLFEVSNDGYWRSVAGTIRAEGKNRATRRKHLKKGKPDA